MNIPTKRIPSSVCEFYNKLCNNLTQEDLTGCMFLLARSRTFKKESCVNHISAILFHSSPLVLLYECFDACHCFLNLSVFSTMKHECYR